MPGNTQPMQVLNIRRGADRTVAWAFGVLITILVAIRLISCYGVVQPRVNRTLYVPTSGGRFSVALTEDGRQVVIESSLTLTAMIVVVMAGIILRRYLRQLKLDERKLRESEDFARSIVDALPAH